MAKTCFGVRPLLIIATAGGIHTCNKEIQFTTKLYKVVQLYIVFQYCTETYEYHYKDVRPYWHKAF